MKNILFKNARVVDVHNNRVNTPLDIYCCDGCVREIGLNLKKESHVDLYYDLEGLWVCPGLIDTNVHLPIDVQNSSVMENVFEEAKRGGVTGIVSSPNTNPFVDKGFLIDYLVSCGDKYGIPVYPLGAITNGLKGEFLSEMAIMKNYGAIGFSDAGHSTLNTEMLRRAMEYAQSINSKLFLDCEDFYLSEGGMIHEGIQSTMSGLRGIPAQSESIIVARNLELAGLTGASIHIQCVSTARSVALIADAKKRGISVTVETAPAYFFLHSGKTKAYDLNFKLKPPLRDQKDCEAIRQAILDDTIDVIASNHRESFNSESDNFFQEAPFCSQNLEHTLALILTEFAEETEEMKAKILSKVSLEPSKILGLNEKNFLKKGLPLNMIVIDPHLLWSVSKGRKNGQQRRSPFLEKSLKGKVLATMISGIFVHNDLKGAFRLQEKEIEEKKNV